MSKEIFYKDRLPDNETIDSALEKRVRLIEEARYQLDSIKPILEILIHKIIYKKPDRIVFLDKSARIFGSPLHALLKTLNLDKIPDISFYNDKELKRRYIDGERLADIERTDFAPYKDDRIFFVDETFSYGKISCALKKISEDLDIDLWYFALSKDPKPRESEFFEFTGTHELPYGIPTQILLRQKREVRDDPKFIIGDFEQKNLFSDDAGTLYITESTSSPQKTEARFRVLTEKEADEEFRYEERERLVPHARAFADVPDGSSSWAEHDKEIRMLNFETIKILKKLIYDTLVSIHGVPIKDRSNLSRAIERA